MNTTLLNFIRENEIPDNMYWKNNAQAQESFWLNTVGEHLCKVPIFVLNTHYSKSIMLPVYGFTMRNGIKIIASDNFHGIYLSVELPLNVSDTFIANCKNLFTAGVDQPVSYMYGFKNEWIYGLLTPGCKKFSVELSTTYDVYAFLYMLNDKSAEIKEYSNNYSEDDICNIITEIHNANPEVDLWNGLWYTYYHLSEVARQKDNQYISGALDITTPQHFTNYLIKYPECMQTFLMEANMYQTVF